MSEREFVVINEEAARTAQNMMSFNEYQLGSRTKEYQEDVNEVYDLAEEVVARRGEEYRERAWRLATRYAKNLGKYFNEEARIGCMCPSVMISGAGNFPVKKKEKYNIGFINSDGMEDETQFESVKTLKELSDLFRDFCKENGFKTNTVTFVEAV